MANNNIIQSITGKMFNSKLIMDKLFQLTYGIGPRFAGTANEFEAAQFIKDYFIKTGLEDVELDSFSFDGWASGEGNLYLDGEKITATPLPFSPSRLVEGQFIFIDEGTKENYKNIDVSGKVVMVTSATPSNYRKLFHRIEKYNLAVENGAAGFIYMNHYPGNLPVTGAVQFDKFGEIPAVGISCEKGHMINNYFDNDGKISIEVKADIEKLTSQNVIGWIKGPSSTIKKPPILVGAHYDSHFLSHGAVDNAVAVSIIMELASVFSCFKDELKRPLIISVFGAEEIGLLGSKNIMSKEWVEDVAIMVNVDGIGCSPKITFNTQGFDNLKQLLVEIADQIGINIKVTNYEWPYTDHWPFVKKGIPSFQIRPLKEDVGRGWGHTNADTIDKVSALDVKINGTLISLILSYLLFGDDNCL